MEYKVRKELEEDAPTMSMAGGGIASRDMGLGGNKIQALRSALIGSVFRKLRSKVKTI